MTPKVAAVASALSCERFTEHALVRLRGRNDDRTGMRARLERLKTSRANNGPKRCALWIGRNTPGHVKEAGAQGKDTGCAGPWVAFALHF